MNTALWITASLLSAAYLAGGLSLLLMTKEKYRSLGASQLWVDDFDEARLKAIGAVKVTGAVGLTVPAVLGVGTVLVPLAASGLMLFMAGAGTTRFRRGEWKLLVADVAYLSLFAFLAWGRFDLEPFS